MKIKAPMKALIIIAVVGGLGFGFNYAIESGAFKVTPKADISAADGATQPSTPIIQPYTQAPVQQQVPQQQEQTNVRPLNAQPMQSPTDRGLDALMGAAANK